MKTHVCILILICLGASTVGAAPVRTIRSSTFMPQVMAGPDWDPFADEGQWFLNPTNDTMHVSPWELHDDDDALAIEGVVQSITYDGTPSSNIVAFDVLATVVNNLPSEHPLNTASNSHGEVQMLIEPSLYSGILQDARITAEFAIADTLHLPNGIPPYYTDPVSGGGYYIEAVNEDEWAWYCWANDNPEQTPPGDFQVPTWRLGDIVPGGSQSVLMQFVVTGTTGMPISDYRHSVIRYSQSNQADVLYNRHTSLKISHWLDTLLIDNGATNIITAPPGEYEEPPPEYIYASDASVFFDWALDWGDAPAPYPTLSADNGPRHIVLPGLFLGQRIDTESDGLPDALALGDDNHGFDDEDGIQVVTNCVRGTSGHLIVTASTNGYLQAWIDFNHNHSWLDAAEQIAADLPLAPGTNLLVFPIPSNAVPGPAISRFRFGSYTGTGPTGLAWDGEIEDHAINIFQPAPLADFSITNMLHPATNCCVIQWKGDAANQYDTYYTETLSSNTVWTHWGATITAPPYQQTNLTTTTNARFYRVIAPFTAP